MKGEIREKNPHFFYIKAGDPEMNGLFANALRRADVIKGQGTSVDSQNGVY